MQGIGRFGGPGGDLLFRVLRRSTIGAEGFHGRVRDGIGCITPRNSHQVIQGLCRDERLFVDGCEPFGRVFGFVGFCSGCLSLRATLLVGWDQAD